MSGVWCRNSWPETMRCKECHLIEYAQFPLYSEMYLHLHSTDTLSLFLGLLQENETRLSINFCLNLRSNRIYSVQHKNYIKKNQSHRIGSLPRKCFSCKCWSNKSCECNVRKHNEHGYIFGTFVLFKLRCGCGLVFTSCPLSPSLANNFVNDDKNWLWPSLLLHLLKSISLKNESFSCRLPSRSQINESITFFGNKLRLSFVLLRFLSIFVRIHFNACFRLRMCRL